MSLVLHQEGLHLLKEAVEATPGEAALSQQVTL